VIYYCWAALTNKVNPVICSTAESDIVLDWYRDLHGRHIQAADDPYVASEKSVPILDSTFQSMALALATLIKAVETGHTSAAFCDQKKQPGFNKLPAHTRHMILMAAEPCADAMLMEPPVEAQDFFEQTTVGKAHSHLHQELSAKFNSSVEPSQALVAALHTGHFILDRISCPLNFSVFLCGRSAPLSSAARALCLHMKCTEGEGLTYRNIDNVLKQERFLPTDMNVAAEQIRAFYSCVAEFFQAEGPLSADIQTDLKRLLVNKPMHKEHQASNRNFLSIFLFLLDLMVQHFLWACCDTPHRCDIDERMLDIQITLDTICDLMFNINLP
jgi:hypothetical protein